MLKPTYILMLQPYGEFDPKFVKEHYCELGQRITIMDRRGNTKDVEFNLSPNYPLIINGWTELRQLFGIVGNKIILMSYLGDNRFVLHVQSDDFSPLKLPYYHTYRYVGLEPEPFEVKLTKYYAEKYKLVS
jgi:hypothetical protein